jgi:hypothetical protein
MPIWPQEETDPIASPALAALEALVATDAELAAAVATLSAGIAAKQDSATAATDAELASAIATLNAAMATDAELASAVTTLNTALGLKQDALTAATDAELAAAVAAINAVIATDSELAAAVAAHNASGAAHADIRALIGSGGIIPPWTGPGTVFLQYQPVTNGGVTYLAVDAHTSGATFVGDAAHWSPLPVESSRGLFIQEAAPAEGATAWLWLPMDGDGVWDGTFHTYAPPTAPVSTVAPVISGTATPGSTLTTTNGTWTQSPTSYTYQWKRAGVAISGQTASTHVVVTADVAQAITCTVTATNATGAAAATSNTLTPAPSVPANTVAPAVTGTAVTGQTLTTSTGTWTGSPAPTYAYVWKRAGSAISGATASTYVLLVADEGLSVKCSVTATNASGAASADSNAVTPTAAPTAPANTVAPAVTGTATVGQTLACSTGTWTGTPTITYAYQWKRAGSAISGATSSTYALVAADASVAVKCTVTATNGTGSASADSNTVTPAATVPGAPTSLNATAGDAQVVLTWTAPASNGGSAITDYVVEKSPAGAGTWTTFADGTSATTGATVTGLTNATAYDFRVSTVNAIGTGTPSATASATPVAAFDPLSLSPAAWYKSDTLSALADGAAVSSWTDSSGNARHAVQATGGNQPICKKAIVNGKDVVRFDGVDDFLRAAFTLVQPEYFVIVMRLRTTVVGRGQYVVDGAPTQNTGVLYDNNLATRMAIYAGAGPVSGALAAVDTWRQYGILFSGAASEIRVDGGTAVTGSAGTSSMSGVTLGAGGGATAGTSAAAVDIAEFFIFSAAPSTPNRTALEGYLRTKYATA